MSKSVMICKIAYYQPHSNSKGQSTNAAHIQYIATKPEADRGDEAALCAGDDEEELAVEPDSAACHVEYAAERPGSSGLFGPADPPAWREVARELAHHDLPTWRVIVSLREDDAARLGFTERSAWEIAVRDAIPRVVGAIHLSPEHARWVAAFHQKTGHPHVHIVVWERLHEAARRRGLLEPGERKEIWRAFAREIFSQERIRLMAEKSALRDAIRDLAKASVGDLATARLQVQALEGGQPGVPPVLQTEQQAELARRLQALAAALPAHGRVALAYMPAEVKAQVRELANWLLSLPRFNESVSRYADLARQLASHYTAKPEILAQAARTAIEGLRDRVAQVVLKAAAQVGRAENRVPAESRVFPPAHAAARGVAKGVWRAIERERLRAEARAQLASRHAARRAEARAQAERERQARAEPER